MRRYFSVAVLAFLFFIVSPVLAETVTFTREYTYQANEFDSEHSSRTLAFETVKRLLIEDIGTYLADDTQVKDMRLTKDQVTTYSVGIVSVEILDVKWDGKSYWLKAKVSADLKEAEKNLEKLVEDKYKTQELEETRKRVEELTKENVKLRREIGSEAKNAEAYEKTIKGLNAIDWLEKGFKAGVTGRSEEARDAFTKAIELKDDDAMVYYSRGEAYLDLGNYQQALGDYSKAIELKPGLVDAYHGRGLSYVGLGDYQQAINDFTRTIELKPDFVEAYYGRGLSYLVLGNYEQALADIKSAARLGHKDAQDLLIKRGDQW
ncbi:MAG TPA: tetratricopeptide repeat protein [Dissulfurispiraceae bacterium]|nr:tetratricopeptide repeat protein [Dissulfurispiraceae bacterium]